VILFADYTYVFPGDAPVQDYEPSTHHDDTRAALLCALGHWLEAAARLPATATVTAPTAAVAAPPKKSQGPECVACLEFLLEPMAFKGCSHHICAECGDTLVATTVSEGGAADATPCPTCRAKSALIPATDARSWIAEWCPAAHAAALEERAVRRDPVRLARRMSETLGARVRVQTCRENVCDANLLLFLRAVRDFHAWRAATPTAPADTGQAWYEFFTASPNDIAIFYTEGRLRGGAWGDHARASVATSILVGETSGFHFVTSVAAARKPFASLPTRALRE